MNEIPSTSYPRSVPSFHAKISRSSVSAFNGETILGRPGRPGELTIARGVVLHPPDTRGVQSFFSTPFSPHFLFHAGTKGQGGKSVRATAAILVIRSHPFSPPVYFSYLSAPLPGFRPPLFPHLTPPRGTCVHEPHRKRKYYTFAQPVLPRPR